MIFLVDNGSMFDVIHEKLEAAIHEASGMYERLVLLAGHSGTGKTNHLQQLGKRYSSTVLNVSQLMSQALLELSKRQRVLSMGTAPATVNEVKDRFVAFLASLTKGTDSAKVRIIIRP